MPRSKLGNNNSFFTCKNCHKKVYYKAQGTKNRNHCPFCLYSLHVDSEVGDRKSTCGGLMRPIGKIYKSDGEEVLVHECLICHQIRKNRIAGDDDWDLMANLALIEHL